MYPYTAEVRANSNVVYVGLAKNIQVLAQNVTNEVLDGGRCIGEAELFDHVLVVSETGTKGGFPLFPVGYAQPVIGAPEVQLREPLGLVQSHQGFLNYWKGVPILYHHLSDPPVVDT